MYIWDSSGDFLFFYADIYGFELTEIWVLLKTTFKQYKYILLLIILLCITFRILTEGVYKLTYKLD